MPAQCIGDQIGVPSNDDRQDLEDLLRCAVSFYGSLSESAPRSCQEASPAGVPVTNALGATSAA